MSGRVCKIAGIRPQKINQLSDLSVSMLLCFCFYTFFLIFSPSAYAQSLDTSRVFPSNISAQQVYQNPDDHGLNLEFAKQQVRKGEMLTAAAALERMLYANPNWHSARLFYAHILYRLDDQKAALRELDLLKRQNLNDYQKETMERYKVKFQTPPGRLYPSPQSDNDSAETISRQYKSAYTRTSGQGSVHDANDPIKAQVIVGGALDSNAGNKLTEALFGFNDLGDVSGVFSGRVKATKQLSEKNDLVLRAEVNGQLQTHQTFREADYSVADARLGVSFKSDETSHVYIDSKLRRLNVSGEAYLTQFGPQVTVTKQNSPRRRTSVSFSGEYQDYQAITQAPLEDLRDGVKLQVNAGVLQKIQRKHTLGLSLGYEVKTANLDAFAYDGPKASVQIISDVADRWKFKGRAAWRHLDYDGRLSGFGPDRKDNRLSGRLAMAYQFDTGSKSAQNQIGIEAGVNYNLRASNIDSNDFENFGTDVRVIFDF